MIATNQFFLWFYYGLNGLGGWFLFFLLGFAAVLWLLYDTARRRLPALGWRMGIILVFVLILPAALYRFSVNDPTDIANPLAPFAEPIFYLGLLGGVLPPVVAAGFYVTYQGLAGCYQGHIYDAVLGECPICAQASAPPPVYDVPAPYPAPTPIPQPPPGPPPKPKTHAWLVSVSGHDYQLNQGETTVGRSTQNDIQISGDPTVSRQHIKIFEQNNHFHLVDLGAQNRTRVNGKIVRQRVLLEPDDEIQLGDNTTLRFITSRR